MNVAPVAASAWWALRHHARSALAVSLVVALGVASSAPGLWLAPSVTPTPLRDTPWEAEWSSLSVSANVARDVAVATLTRTVWVSGVAALLVAALTIVALSVVRSARRRSDFVIRRSVGASKRVLSAAATVEGGVMATVGLAAGIAGVALLEIWLPSTFRTQGSAVALVAGLGAVVVLGALTPLRFARGRVPGVDATGGSVSLVVPGVQFGLGLVGLLAGAQLSHRLESTDGARTATTGTITALTFADSTPNVPQLLVAALRAAHRDPRVALASVSSPGTLVGLGHVDMITTDCGRCSQGGLPTPLRASQATNHLATADTFRALGLRAVSGRVLSDADELGSERVAVVNRYLAEREFERGGAVGRFVRVGGPDNWYRVVGIVEDAHFDALGSATVPQRRVYLSALQHHATELDVLVRRADGGAFTLAIPGAVAASSRSEAEIDEREHAVAQWFARALLIGGWGSLVLATFGMLAVMRVWTSGALPEVALRRAVGARRRHVVGRAALRATMVVGGGIALAWWLEPLGTAALARAIPGLPAGSPVLVGVPLLALAAATFAASVVPAWRAARAAPAALPGFSDL